jgi:hypothetical protein
MLNKVLVLLLVLVVSSFAKLEMHKGKVVETLNSGGYSYIKLSENKKEFWVAIKQTKVVKGETIEVMGQMWMNNFQSKTLNKTFDKILFAVKKGENKAQTKNPYMSVNSMPSLAKTVKNTQAKPSYLKAVLLSVKDLKAKKTELKNKAVSVNGEIIKISLAVMNSDWVHVGDSIGDKIIFRSANTSVKVGDKVTARGTLNTDVDYGYGYTYETIIVDSQFVVQK